MARKSGSNAWLALIVGALLVVVAAIGYVVWSGQGPAPQTLEVDLKIPTTPDLPDPTPMPNPQPIPPPAPKPG